MSSTEQKNVTQHFISHVFTFGIVPTIRSGRFSSFGLRTGVHPFEALGETGDLHDRLTRAADCVKECRLLLPITANAPITTRVSPLLLKLTQGAQVSFGNHGVMRFIDLYYRRTWGVHLEDTPAIKHAEKHAKYIHASLAPAAYGRIERAKRNATSIAYSKRAREYRCAADSIERLAKLGTSGKYSNKIRSWCSNARKALNLRSTYTKSTAADSAYSAISSEAIKALPSPPSIQKPGIRTSKNSKAAIDVYVQGSLTYIRLARQSKTFSTTPSDDSEAIQCPFSGKTLYATTSLSGAEVFVFNYRDFEDIKYLFHAGALYHTYIARRASDYKDRSREGYYRRAADSIWNLYCEVIKYCGANFAYRNKLGVYFDVLQWRYLAYKSGDEFYDHSAIMRGKLISKGISTLPSQESVLGLLRGIEMDVAIDLLGIYKASIYPEVDPFAVVTDQYKLHMERFNTDWEDGSDEQLRFNQTRAYMWYLGTRVLRGILKYWPGKIREGAEEKPWHSNYRSHGIPGDLWRDACDVDLTGCFPQSDLTEEQYMRQADSACAPPHTHQYRDFWAMRKAPRRHKRKILYAIQEPELPDLCQSLQHLNDLGRTIPDGYTGKVEHDLGFSVDIVTGSRCERHKEAPRPFYAASSPWGCILSYFDGITRDFLTHVPQCMLGKSSRQKFIDISTASDTEPGSVRYFYVSDDKAKYSPHMDPNSQQLPAEFFAEIFGIPAFRAYGPIMYHCELYYRVCGHLVHYNSNGTDREGMRGASNTWLEIVAQGLATRLSREKGLTQGKSLFLSFIDDALRRFSIPTKGKTDEGVRAAAREVLEEVIFGLKVLGRELSWDKTFVSSNMYVILNEIIYDGSHFSSGLKSYVTAGDIEMKEVMTAADYEQLYFGKMKGALGVGTPIDLAHITYVYETIMWHYKMGLRLQDNKRINAIDYRMFCITPIALGGAGIRSMMQMGCTENANATKEGIGNLARLCQNFSILKDCFYTLLQQPMETVKPVDFMREPEQIHIAGPRIKTQRVAAVVRSRLLQTACNSMSRAYMEQDAEGMAMLNAMGMTLMASGDVSAAEVRLLYSMSPVAFIDEFIQKLASSSTISQLLTPAVIHRLRASSRKDLIMAANVYSSRCGSHEVISALRQEPEMWFVIKHWFV